MTRLLLFSGFIIVFGLPFFSSSSFGQTATAATVNTGTAANTASALTAPREVIKDFSYTTTKGTVVIRKEEIVAARDGEKEKECTPGAVLFDSQDWFTKSVWGTGRALKSPSIYQDPEAYACSFAKVDYNNIKLDGVRALVKAHCLPKQEALRAEYGKQAVSAHDTKVTDNPTKTCTYAYHTVYPIPFVPFTDVIATYEGTAYVRCIIKCANPWIP